MLKRYLSLVIVGLLIHAVGAGPASASPQADKQDQLTAKVKADVAKRGVGEKAGVTVKLRDKTEVKGYVYQAGEDNFVVRNSRTGADTTVAYRDVTEVKAKGISKGAKIGIGVGIAAVVVVAVAAVIFSRWSLWR